MLLFSLVTGLFFLVLLLNQRWFPRSSFKFQTAVLSVLPCDVPSTAVCDSESIKCFPGAASKFSLKRFSLYRWLQLLLVWFYIVGSTVVASLYINSCIIASFPLPFVRNFCLRVLPSLSMCMFSLFLFLIIISRLFALLLLLLLLLFWIKDKSTAFCEAKGASWAKGFRLLTDFKSFLFVITNQHFRSTHNLPNSVDRGISRRGKASPNLLAVTIYIIMLLRLKTCEALPSLSSRLHAVLCRHKYNIVSAGVWH